MVELDDDIEAMTEVEALQLAKQLANSMNATIKHTPHGYLVAADEKEIFSADNAKTMLSALRRLIQSGEIGF